MYTVPYIQTVLDRNVVPLFRLAALYKRYKMRGHYCSTFKPAAEVVTEPDRHLCKRDSWHCGNASMLYESTRWGDIMPPLFDSV